MLCLASCMDSVFLPALPPLHLVPSAQPIFSPRASVARCHLYLHLSAVPQGEGGGQGLGLPVSLLLHQPWESRPPHLQPSLGLSLRPAVPCVWPGGWCTYNPTTQWPMTTQAGIYSENLSPNNRCPQSKKETWWGLGKKPKGSTATSRGHLCQRQGESLNWRGAHKQVPNVNIYLEPCKKLPCHARPVFLH